MAIVTGPSHGTVTNNADGTITYTPDADFCGTDTFEYTITDGEYEATAQVTVEVFCVDDTPALSVVKEGPDHASVGETVVYRFRVINDLSLGDGSPLHDVRVVDDLAGEASYESGDDGDNLLEGGETWVFVATYTVQPDDPTPLVNTAVASAIDVDGDTITAQDSHSLVIEANLSVEKADSPDPVVAGTELTYTITVVNRGPSEARNVVVTEAYDPWFHFESASPAPSTGNNRWDFPVIAAGESVSITIVGTVDPAAPEGATVENTVEVGSDTDDPDPDDNEVTVSTQVEALADLALDKSDNPDPVHVNSTLTYTITVTNAGPSDAVDVVITDPLVPCLTDAAYSVNGTPQGNWDGDHRLARIPAGETVVVSIEATALLECGCRFGSEARVSAATEDPNPGNNSDSEVTELVYTAGLELELVPDIGRATLGDVITYTVILRNRGDVPIADIQVSDTLTGFSTHVDELDVGETSEWITAYAVTEADLCTPVVNTVSAEGAAPCRGERVSAQARAEVKTYFNASMELTKTSSATERPEPGDVITYEITVTNTGNVPLRDVAVVDRQLDFEATIAELQPGSSRTFAVEYEVRPEDVSSSIVNTAEAVAKGPCGTVVGPIEASHSTPWENTPPEAENRTYTTTEGTPVRVRLYASDRDLFFGRPELHPLRFAVAGAPDNGMVSGDLSAVVYVEPNRAYVELVYTPRPGFVGTDTFRFTVWDPFDEFDMGTITVVVEEKAGPVGGVGVTPVRPLAITEVAWGGTPANPDHEWIELFNLTSNPIDLTGWVLRWRAKRDPTAPWVEVPLVGVVRPGEYFLIERMSPDAVADIPAPGKADMTYDTEPPYDQDLPDTGAVMELVDPKGEVVDTANAAPDIPGWYCGYSLQGSFPFSTMERIDPAGPDTPDNWAANADIVVNGTDVAGNFIVGTPKMANEDLWLFSPITREPVTVIAGRTLEVRIPADVTVEPYVVLVSWQEDEAKWSWERYKAFKVEKLDEVGVWLVKVDTSSLSPGSYQLWISLSRFRVYGLAFRVVEAE